MVSHRRRRSILTAIGLYALAAGFIAYFGVHAFTGNHGLRAQQQIAADIAELSEELARVKSERIRWEQKISLLRSDRLDPDMLDERARALLDYSDARDATLLLKTR
jgi:cell division protein FtsB